MSLGRIAGQASDYVRVRYMPTTTIPGHTKLRLQAVVVFDRRDPGDDGRRTLTSASLLADRVRVSCCARDLGFSGGGSLRVSYAETPAATGGPGVTHSGTSWTFAGNLPVAAKFGGRACDRPDGRAVEGRLQRR